MKFITRIYTSIISNRNFISFFSGILVSGYVVSISLNQDNTIWHWLTVLCGLASGIFCYVLIRIGESFEDNLKAKKKNNPKLGRLELRSSAWDSINAKDIEANKLLKILPATWVPLCAVAILTLCLLGFCSLRFGIKENQEKNKIEKDIELKQLIEKIKKANQESLVIPSIKKPASKNSLKKEIDSAKLHQKLIIIKK